MKRTMIALGTLAIVGLTHAQDDPVRQMQEDSLRRSQQQALDNYNRQAQEQRQMQQAQQLRQAQVQRTAEPISLNTGRDFLDAQKVAPDMVHGYVLAMFDVSGSYLHLACPPPNVDIDSISMVAIVNDYIKADPVRLSQRTAGVVGSAFMQKWPCPKQK